MTLTFTTNINCLGCIQAVVPHLEGMPGIKSWQVDIVHPHKILTVETDKVTRQEIVESVREAGFEAQPLD